MKFPFLKHVFYLALASMTLFTAACGGDGNNDGPIVPDEPSLTVSPESLTFDSYDGRETQQLTITSTKYVKVVAADDWCVLATNSSSVAGNYVYDVTPTANKEKEARSTKIRILQNTTELKVVAVTQAGRPENSETEASTCLWGLGWNYGNQLDAWTNGKSNETAWGNPVAGQATFDGVKRAGFQTVRIPITWMGHIGDAPEYKIEDAWMDRVAEVVGYCETAGLNAIINIHHDGSADSQDKYNGWLQIGNAAKDASLNEETLAKITAVWKQVATRFQDKGEWLMFETFNEIQDGGWGWGANRNDGGKQYQVLNVWNQTAVDAIRSVGGQNSTRWIGVPGYSTNIDLTVDNLVLPQDEANRLAVSVHCYDPYDFTLACTKDTYSAADINSLKKQFQKLKETYLDRGIQCYIGEFSCVQRTNESAEATRLKYLTEYAQAAREAGLSIVLWDNNADNGGKGGKECNAYIDHATGDYKSDKGQAAVEAIVRGYAAEGK